MIREATSEDLGRIKEIAVAAGMFSVDDVEFFDEMFAGAQDGSLEGHTWLSPHSRVLRPRRRQSRLLESPHRLRSCMSALA